jgi:peptidoglycan/xylan/chitin deacetylase (PgdA/CDA1 family)
MIKGSFFYLLLISTLTILTFFATSCNKMGINTNTNSFDQDHQKETSNEISEANPVPKDQERPSQETPKEKEPSKSESSEITASTNPPISYGREKNIPILYYHAVSDTILGIEELFVSPSDFEQQMLYLKDNSYSIITFDDLPEIEKYEKPVIITFDDGYENNYTKAYPILKKFNFPAVIFLTTDYMDKNNYLKQWQIEEMKDLISFEAHAVSHPDLTTLSLDALTYELTESKKILKDLTGRESIAFAYPFGIYNQTVIDVTKKHFTYAVTINSGLFFSQDNHYTIKRVYIPRKTTIGQFETRLQKGFIT